MTGGKAPRQKGNREERDIVNDFQDAGVFAERIPLSGSAGGSYVGDVTVAVQGEDWVGESKVRGNGFKLLYDALADHKCLFVRADRRERLVVLRQSDFIRLAKVRP